MTKRRGQKGNFISEFPAAIFIFLLAVLFPLIDLAVLFFGVSSVHSACRTATVAAARAQSFSSNTSPTKLSAVNLAKKIASESSTGGVSILPSDVQIKAFQVPILGGQAQEIVPSPNLIISTNDFTYQIRVTVTGRVSPLVMLSSSLFGQVQGLTIPMVVTATSTSNFENVNGLLE
jgi:Flp pilus assembly protein TadG